MATPEGYNVSIRLEIVNIYEGYQWIEVGFDTSMPFVIIDPSASLGIRRITKGETTFSRSKFLEFGSHVAWIIATNPPNRPINAKITISKVIPEGTEPILVYDSFFDINTRFAFSFDVIAEPPFIITEPTTPKPTPIPTPLEEVDISTNDPNTKNLLESAGVLVQNLWGGITGFPSQVFDISGSLLTLITSGLMGLISAIPDLFKKSQETYLEKILSEFESLKEGSPEWVARIGGEEGENLGFFMGKPIEAIDPLKWIPKEPTPKNYINQYHLMSKRLAEVEIGGQLIGTGIESASLGQIEGFTGIFGTVTSMVGVREAVQVDTLYPIQMSMIEPYKQSVNMTFPTLIPPYTDLIRFRVKEKISEQLFNDSLARQGFSNEWAKVIWESHYNPPSYGEILKAKYRTDMTDERFLELIKIVDLDEIFNEEVWIPNMGEIPAVSELTNQRVKEVIGKKLFAKYLKHWGYSTDWENRIWEAHFMPPSLNDILTAYRREIPVDIPEYDEDKDEQTTRHVDKLSVDDVHILMKLVDLDERYQTIFDTRLYEDPTIRDARYMYEIGAYEPDDVKAVLRRRGYNPTDQENLVKYLISFRERGYYTKYLTAVQTALNRGVVDEAFVEEACKTPEYPLGLSYWILKIANLRKQIDEAPTGEGKSKILTLGELKKGFVRGIISPDSFRIKLTQLGYDTLDIELLIEILAKELVTEKEGTRTVVLSISQLLNAFRYGKLTEDQVKQRIMLRGLDQQETDLLIETMQAKWEASG